MTLPARKHLRPAARNLAVTAAHLGLLGAILLCHLKLYPYAFDDAFIHMRVARNLVETGAPYFNPGEAVKVSSSSGWVVVLAGLYVVLRWLGHPDSLPFVVAMVNALLVAMGAFVFSRIALPWLPTRVSQPAALVSKLVYVAIVLIPSVGLMETALAMLLAGLGILNAVHAKPLGYGLLALAVGVRVELAVLLLVCCALATLQRSMAARRVLVAAWIGLLPMLLFDLSYYHTVIPHAIIAKRVVYSLDAAEVATRGLFLAVPALPADWGLVRLAFGLGFLLIPAVGVLAGISAWRERKDLMPLALSLWGLLTAGGYILGRALIFEWYAPLYVVPWVLACAAGIGLRMRVVHSLAALCVLLMAATSVISVATGVYASVAEVEAYCQFEPGSRVRTYLRVGEVLHRDYPEATLLTSEIGALGYSFRGYMIDGAGLASPEALQYHPLSVPSQRDRGDIGGIPPEMVRVSSPDLIVSYDVFAKALLNHPDLGDYATLLLPPQLEDDRLRSRTGLVWGSRYLRVYLRRGLAVTNDLAALAW